MTNGEMNVLGKAELLARSRFLSFARAAPRARFTIRHPLAAPKLGAGGSLVIPIL